MLPEPLHPAVVHFPLVLAFLLPMFALGGLWAISRGARPMRGWALPFAFAAVLAASGWVALETGEAEEEKVEGVVAEAALEAHEEAAERFLVLSGLLLVVAGVGLVGGTVGAAGRVLTAVGSLGVLVAAISVGGAGGDLVYHHGAAGPYVAEASGGAGPAPSEAAPEESRRREEDDD
jgi:uncharacterized membrane protein